MASSRRPSVRPPVALAFVVLALQAGCGDGSRASGEAEVPTLRLGAPDVRFGSVDDPVAALVPAGSARLGPDGRLWVAQPQDFQLLAVSPDGAPPLRIGGPGEGPGEFAGVGATGWLGDTLWVADGRAGRITFFGPDGALRGDTPLPRADVEDGFSAAFTALLADGALFVLGPSGNALVGAPPVPETSDPVVVTPREGGAARPIGLRSGVYPRAVVTETSGGQIQAIFIHDQPWSDGTLVEAAPDGRSVVVVDRRVATNDEAPSYRVTRLGTRGDTLWSTARRYAPVPVDAARQDSFLTATSRGGAPLQSLKEAIFLPATLTPASSVFVGLDGRVWVGRERPPGAAEWRWDVFGSEGALEAVVVAPASVTLRAADGDHVWGIETDAYEVPYVVRFAVPGG